MHTDFVSMFVFCVNVRINNGNTIEELAQFVLRNIDRFDHVIMNVFHVTISWLHPQDRDATQFLAQFFICHNHKTKKLHHHLYIHAHSVATSSPPPPFPIAPQSSHHVGLAIMVARKRGMF